MDESTMNKSVSLFELITRTRKAVDQLQTWIDQSTEQSFGGHYKNDFNYNLALCKFSDGSGPTVNLARYFGNTRLLATILLELKAQLFEFETEYNAL